MVDGMPIQLYSKGMVPTEFWESIKRRYPVGVHINVKEVNFYNDKFALWIDLRSHFDNEVHGSGFFQVVNQKKYGRKW